MKNTKLLVIVYKGVPDENWDRIARRKRGSASSLPALGETETMTIRPTISSQSLAQLETTGGRSLGSTASLNRGEVSPDDTSSPGTKYATLPSRGRKASSRKQSKLVGSYVSVIINMTNFVQCFSYDMRCCNLLIILNIQRNNHHHILSDFFET